ncbi:hypothetical protein J7E52_26180 [Bacillus sp. ISL-34]|uniref:hypothetical protein n=1 Tax=Bacillus sp. ISL-34 TaxID=2819121 RepID=UPI001BE9B837|nr:hypothetical protein [Bacillus sp. ISL-34]MBT2650137.1 hypothetical protein [Bacillus sp. ISL-34]
MAAIIRKILSLLFLFVLFLSLVACNQDAVNQNSEEVNVEEAEKLFKDYSTELYTIKDLSNPPTFDEIAENIKVYLTMKEKLEPF